MKAIILAAGVGKRMGKFLDDNPKCLFKINGRSIINRLVDDLLTYGVKDIVLVVGYKKEQIYDELNRVEPDTKIKYAVNDNYKIGSIISLWTAKDELNDDVIIMDADVVYDKKLLEKLIVSPKKSCFLMDRDFVDTGEEQKLGILNERVMTISKKPLNGQFDFTGEAVGFLKLSGKDAGLLSDALSRAIDRGIDNCEHEEIYDNILMQCSVGYETVDGRPWVEIDFPEDAKKAEEIMKECFKVP